MLIEIWERLRGYDKWVETQATIKTSQLSEVVVAATRSGQPIYGWQGDEQIAWTDRDGVEQCEPLTVSENSPVFKMYDGNPLVIRYDPELPYHSYVREQLRYELKRRAAMALVVLAVLAGVLVMILYQGFPTR